MRKGLPLLLVLLLATSSLVPAITVEAEEESQWLLVERGSSFERYQNPANLSQYILATAPLWVFNGSQYVPYIFHDNYTSDGFYQVQSGRIGVRIYDYYAEFWDVNMTEVRLYDERWEVLRWSSQGGGSWSDVGAQSGSPIFSVSQDETGINITKFFTSWAGQLEIIYIFREGRPLKHAVYFDSILVDETVYQVEQKWAGIVAAKVKHDNGKEVVSSAITLNSSQFRFLKEDDSLSIHESQWDMYYGYNETTGEDYILENENLKPVEIDVHTQGLKADFIFGNWTLTQNEELVIDPSTWSNSNPTVDGYIAKEGASYILKNDIHLYTGPRSYASAIYRAFVQWDVTGIPDAADVTDVDFIFECEYDRYGRVSGIFEMTLRPSTTGNEALYGHIGTQTQYVAYNGFVPSAGTNKVQDLGSSADSDLEGDLAGNWFAIGMRMSDETAGGSHANEGIYSDNYAATPDPTLYVTYSLVSAPSVTTLSATLVEETTANPRGEVTAIGGENPTRYIEYDINSGSPYTYSENCGVGGTGIYNSYLTGLTPGEKYYYRAKAVNTGGTASGSEMTFITKPNAPSSLNAYSPTDSQISLSWTKGTGAYYTYVIRKVGSYPANIGDGVQVYANTGSGTTDSSLSPGVHYFYRAWSRAYDGEWGPYSDSYSSDAEYTKPSNPSGLTATAVGETQIDLAWTKGTGGDKTHIRRKIGSYPTSTSDGDQAYFDTGVSKEDTGLVGGNDYYYRGWAYDTDSGYYSSGYTEDWDRTPQSHESEVSQSVSLTSDSYRSWSTGRIVSQGMSLISEGQRTLGAQRDLSQGFTLASSTSRSWQLLRIAVQSVVPVFEGNRMLSAVRSPGQNIQFNFETGRLWTLMKQATQSLSTIFNAERSWSTLKALTQSLSMTSGAGRTLGAIRVLTQSITATFNVERLWSTMRTVSQGIVASVNALKTGNYFKILSQEVSANFNTWRMWSTTRALTQSITATFNANRILTAIRILPQTLTASFNSLRSWSLLKTVAQSISLNANAGRYWATSRLLTQAISTIFNNERLWSLSRAFTQGISTTFNGERILAAIRTVYQDLTATVTAFRTVNYLKFLSQGVSTVFSTERYWVTSRILMQEISASFNAHRIWSLMRTVSQGISLSLEGNRILTLIRSATQGITTAFNIERTWDAIRTASQTIAAAFDIERVWSTSRTITQGISAVFNAERLWSLSRIASQSISATFNALRAGAFTRMVSQSMSFVSNTFTHLYEFLAETGTLTITTAFNAFREWSLLRTMAQSLTANFNAGRSWTALRLLTQSISTTFNMERLWSLSRTVSQSLSLVSSAFGKKFIHFIERTVSLMVETSFNAIREWSLLRTVAQSLTANFNAERLWTLLRTSSQTLGMSFNALREWSLMRELSQSITSSFEAVRELNLLRLVAQSLDINLNAERGWTLLRTLTQTVVASFESGRLWTALRVASQSITAGFNAERGWTLLRTLTQPLTASFNAGRWWMQVRIVTQTISTSFNSVRFWTAFRGISQTITTALSADRIFTAIRQASQNIAFNSGTERLATFLRVIAQLITMSSETLRTWSLSRTLGQGLSFASSIFVKLTKFIPPPEEFFRALSMGIAFVSNSIRNWGQNRMLSQGISFASNSIRQWNLSRAFTQGLNFISEARTFMGVMKMQAVSLSLEFATRLNLYFTLLNEFKVALLMLNMLTLLATGMFLGRGRNVSWGAVSTFLWFITALATIVDDPSNWIFVRVYAMIGTILIALTLIRAIQGLNPEDQYFEDWEE